MEKSIKRVEKLIHVTNSALAQMKFSLMFDDVDVEGNRKWPKESKNSDPVKFLEGDDLQQCQNEFQSEANEMLEKMEHMFLSNKLHRKNSKAIERIKEINRQMSNLKLRESKPEETEQSRKKLLSLISEEKFSPRAASSKESIGVTLVSRGTKSPDKLHKVDSVPSVSKLPVQPKEELKSKILETQEIVNRGFQTARQLTQRVETISKPEKKEKTPGSDKTVSETNTRSLPGKSESNETVNTVKCRRCLRERRKTRETEKVEPNARVIDVKRKERTGSSKLKMQRLPSVHIKGGLQMQKVHSLEIPAGGEGSVTKSNTQVSFLSHEQVEKEKLGGALETVKREHRCCGGEDVSGKFVECFNCGKVTRVREDRVDPKKVDEILQKCNFNVFDPRIDEFVENYGKAGNPDPREELPLEITRQEVKEEAKPEDEAPKKEKRFRIQNLCDRLLRKYKEEAESIETNHLKLDSILQSLFRQVDESREVFEDCDFLKNKRRVPQLTATKPVLVNLTGTTERVRRKRRTSDGVKHRGNKTFKRMTKTMETVEISCPDQLANARNFQEMPSPSSPSSIGKNWNNKQTKPIEETFTIEQNSPKLSDRVTGGKETNVKSSETSIKSNTPPGKPEREKISSQSSSCSSSKSKTPAKDVSLLPWTHNFRPTTRKDETNKITRKKEGKAVSDTSSDNHYESDFETMTNEPEENEPELEEEEEKELEAGGNKLSTISEVDSELEVKPSEEQENKEGDSTEKKKTGDASTKSTPTELVTSLKDILSALQNQFARTESLAEKLTESAKNEKPQPESGGMLWQLPLGTNLVEGLRSARKTRKTSSEESSSEEGGSSLGEIKPRGKSVSDTDSARRRILRDASSASVGFKLDVNIEEMFYSDGEIPTEELVPSKSGSVGEILTASSLG